MLLSLIQLLAGIGVVFLLVAWGVDDDLTGMIAGLLGTFAWAVTAYGLFNIETTSGSTAYSEPAIALVAAAGALVCIVPVLVNPWEFIGDARDESDPLNRV